MHTNDLVIEEAWVADLVARQFPSWSDLPLSKVSGQA